MKHPNTELKQADIIIQRKYYPTTTRGQLTTYSTSGQVTYECVTMELPWKENKNDISCIPAGRYPYQVLQSSPSFKYPHVHIKNVPKRTGIKIHIANFVRQLRGCIAPGLSFADIDLDGTIDVKNSGIALREMLAVIPHTGIIEII